MVKIGVYDWTIGIGLSVGLALVFTAISFKSSKAFLLYLTIFSAIMVYAGMLELWMLIAEIIVVIVVLYMTYKKPVIISGGGD